jgi:hypothetical protein
MSNNFLNYITGRWFYPGTPVSTTNKADCHNITEIMLNVALNTINPNPLMKDYNGPNNFVR